MSEKQTQKEAVFAAVTSVLNEAGIEVNEGDNFATSLTRELRSQVTAILVEGFKGGTIALDKNFENDSDLRTYCSGLTSNWLRKDKRMNGGTAYVAKNPGSRAGSSDPQIKAMRVLLATQTDPAKRAEIQSFIDARLAEIRPSNKSVKTLSAEQIAMLEANGLGHLVSE